MSFIDVSGDVVLTLGDVEWIDIVVVDSYVKAVHLETSNDAT